jgi:two-component system, OmpR family, response regulator ChvI
MPVFASGNFDGHRRVEEEGARDAIRVIFVEDDDHFRDAVQIDLTEEGFLVHAFSGGPEMLSAISAGLQADVVVLDWGLKEILGIDLLSQMRSRAIIWPVVVLSGRNSPTHERLALDRGAADFVDKARGSAVLAVRLRLVADRQSAAVQRSIEIVFHCGRLALRSSVSRACWDDIDVCLTVTEFKVVELLASGAGSFMSYRQIYDSMHSTGFVAGSGEDGYRTNVRSAVKRIRDKFKVRSPDFDCIQTFTSFGYCWSKPPQ